jgi:hypothetical protein
LRVTAVFGSFGGRASTTGLFPSSPTSFAKSLSGSRATSSFQYSKWRCTPVAMPVLPASPSGILHHLRALEHQRPREVTVARHRPLPWSMVTS